MAGSSRLWAAIAAADGGDFDRALGLFEDALTEDPDDPTAHAHLSLTLSRAGRAFGAAEEARRALRLDPELALAHIADGVAALGLDDLPGARRAAADVMRLAPENPNGLQLACLIALQDRDAAALRAAAETLLRAAPGDGLAHHHLSRAAAFEGDGVAAEAHARAALRADPVAAQNHEAIGWAFFHQGRLEQAREAALSALAIDPNSAAAHQVLAAAELRRRPLSGLAHRVGVWATYLPLRKQLAYGCVFVFAYWTLFDILSFAELRTAGSVAFWSVMAFWAALIASRWAFVSAATAHRRAARLKRDY